jgi:putative toxin-antitoxin system antitoxin component (TIGR02293 family)
MPQRKQLKIAPNAHIYWGKWQKGHSMLSSLQASESMTIRERLEIASHGSVQVYDGAMALKLTELGFSVEEIYRFVAPRRTLARRNANGEPLTVEENDGALRIVRIAEMAKRIFGDGAVAFDWLRKPNRGMDGIAPIDLLESETGARLVEQALHQIDHGIYV